MRLQHHITFNILSAVIILFILPTAGYGQSGGQDGWSNSGESFDTRKSESVALRRSLLHTFVPSGVGALLLAGTNNPNLQHAGGGLVAYGIMLGPAMGNFYADDRTRAHRGIATRAAGIGMFTVSSLLYTGEIIIDSYDLESQDDTSFYGVMIITTAITVAGSMAYNIVTAQKSVREYNQDIGYALQLESLRGTGQSFPVLTARINL